MAAPESWSVLTIWVPGDWVPINVALDRIAPDSTRDLAAYGLRHHLLDERIAAAVRHQQHDGKLMSYTLPSAFWRDFEIMPRPTLGGIVQGRIENTPSGKVTHRLRGGGSFYFFISRADLDAQYPPTGSEDVPARRAKPGPKPRGDWPMVVAAWLVQVALDDPSRIRKPNIDQLAIDAKAMLLKKIKWAPKESKELRQTIRELLAGN